SESSLIFNRELHFEVEFADKPLIIPAPLAGLKSIKMTLYQCVQSLSLLFLYPFATQTNREGTVAEMKSGYQFAIDVNRFNPQRIIYFA
ncbi:hypothetical protein, partial [Aeromonas hydrophila]|uniref:hypothetical protein n=1 Tax=Aeromonas hydrophila TaxID=644 RepID=UPI001C4E155F